ncbi:MAG TPA: dihydrolipoamide acetyltransferase family protein, partial [Blastocatellia bacterium]|nr:dihydrolipoamide acetyltransferase family protein [Blastocatellia bacterium]
AEAAEVDGKKVRSSPLVRNIAREHGVNLEEVPGTGLGGRVSKEDILDFIDRKQGATVPTILAPSAPVAPAAPIIPPPAAPSVPVYTNGERITIEPMSMMRRKIAEHMVLSRRTSAHVTTFFEVDFTAIAALRDRVKRNFEERNGVKLTFMPFIIKAVVDALKAFPVVNASVDGENVVYKHDLNVGMAVALESGLIVPVIKQADALSLLGLARVTQDLATRARSKQLKPDEVSGGTFSITNFGLYGGYTATPIINQPQAAILGVGGIHKRPWVVETSSGDAIAIRHIGVLSLSFDHRLIDGAVADQFMAHLKRTLETTDFSSLI